MKNLFITGASSYLGKNLIEALNDYKIFALENSKKIELSNNINVISQLPKDLNEFFNKNYMVAYNHPELQWQLLCISGNTKNIEFHKYQGLKSNVTNTTNKFEKILIKLFPDKKLDDIKVLASISTKEEIEQHLKDLETLKAAYQIANEREQQAELGE